MAYIFSNTTRPGNIARLKLKKVNGLTSIYLREHDQDEFIEVLGHENYKRLHYHLLDIAEGIDKVRRDKKRHFILDFTKFYCVLIVTKTKNKEVEICIFSQLKGKRTTMIFSSGLWCQFVDEMLNFDCGICNRVHFIYDYPQQLFDMEET